MVAAYQSKVLNRMITKAQDRVAFVGREMAPDDILAQVAIRLRCCETATARQEQSAMRGVLKAIRASGEYIAAEPSHPVGMIIEEVSKVTIPDSMMEITKADMEALNDFLRLPYLEAVRLENVPQRDAAIDEVGALLRDTEEDGMTDEDVYRLAAGVVGQGRTSVREGGWEPVTIEDVHDVMRYLDAPPPGSIIQAVTDGSMPSGRALAANFLLAIWAIGARPVELFSHEIRAVDIGRVEDIDELNRMSRRDFGQMFDHPAYSPIEKIMADWKTGTTGIGGLVTSLNRESHYPVLLRIKNAKTTNAPAAREYRYIDISSLPADQVTALVVTSALRHLDASPEKITTTLKFLHKVVTRASRKAHPNRITPINASVMRHAFIERAREFLGPREIAAIVGHTSRRTTTGYGAKESWEERKKKRRGSSGGGAMPLLPIPDLAQIEHLRQQWSKDGIKAAAGAEPMAPGDTPAQDGQTPQPKTDAAGKGLDGIPQENVELPEKQ